MVHVGPDVGIDICHVVPAAAIVARLGANMGDGLDADSAPEPGDLYALSRNATPRRLVTRPGRPARVASGSAVGMIGEAVRTSLALTLIAPTGDLASVTLLRFETGAVMALVDGALEPGVEYTLISTDVPRDAIALADVTPIGLGLGTRVLTGDGAPRQVESLRVGDMVFTRDRGPQPLRDLIKMTLRATGPRAPVVVPAGAIGNSGDLVLARDQRLHLYLRSADMAGASPEVLARASALVGTRGTIVQSGGVWTCHGLVFDRPEIIFAECLAVECLSGSDVSLYRRPRDATSAHAARPARPGQPIWVLPEAPADAATGLFTARNGLTTRAARPYIPHQNG